MSYLPQLMSMNGELRFTADGNWLHDSEAVTHQGLAAYLSRNLKYYPDLGYVIEAGGKCVKVSIDDLPFVIRTIDNSSLPWTIFLNDDSREEFRPETLKARTSGGFSAQVKDGEFVAALLRPAVQSLLPLIEEGPAGTYLLRYGLKQFPITKE